MIVAAVLGVAAILVLGYLLLGGGGSTKPPIRATASPTPTPARGPNNTAARGRRYLRLSRDRLQRHRSRRARSRSEHFCLLRAATSSGKAKCPHRRRRLTPPLTVSNVSPASVFARTGDFSLQVVGDKFVPGVRIVIDGRAMTTRIISAQQVATTVPADMIANPGNRRIEVRTADGALYSNVVSLNVTAAPVPNFTYIGLIGKPRGKRHCCASGQEQQRARECATGRSGGRSISSHQHL